MQWHIRCVQTVKRIIRNDMSPCLVVNNLISLVLFRSLKNQERVLLKIQYEVFPYLDVSSIQWYIWGTFFCPIIFSLFLRMFFFSQEAVNMIQKGQTEERRIYMENTNVPEVADGPRKVPPPPILLCRTDTMMVFKPAPFCSEDGQEVSFKSLTFLPSCEHIHI